MVGQRGRILQIGIDVGGTFTDFALRDDTTGRLSTGKVLTSASDPSIAVLDGLRRMLRDGGHAMPDLVHVVHATTNTVIQRKGRAVGLLTTGGFRDMLTIGRQKRWELYDNTLAKPPPLVPPRHCWEVSERLLVDGSVHRPLIDDEVRAVARRMHAAGIVSVAICFLHAFTNPAHERRARDVLREAAPDMAVSISSEVSPMYREYERASTTVLNAYVATAVNAYLAQLEAELARDGYAHSLYIMQSNGGIAASDYVRRFPVRIIESGPAAGVLAATRLTGAAGTADLLSFDMGGTTAKVCLIQGGKPAIASQFEIDTIRLKKNSGIPMTIPAIDLIEIGSGGGSIAQVAMGAIKVGPESAGSEPGPICYGHGGTRPTVTDADLVLGYLDARYFMGGAMRLDDAGARAGIARDIAAPLGIDVVEAAWGVHEMVTRQMAEAARAITINNGLDPRDFVLIPFGGAGPVHGARLARMLGCPRVLFPRDAGVGSAIGLLQADPSFDQVRTRMTEVSEDTLADINAVFAEMEQAAKEQLSGIALTGTHHITRSCEMRFLGQGYEINVALPSGPYRAGAAQELRNAFFAAYASTYGDHAFERGDQVEGVHWKLTARLAMQAFCLAELEPGDGSTQRARKGSRQVYFPESAGFADCPVFDRAHLRTGDVVDGPAIIEERDSTLVLPPQASARVDEHGHVILDLLTGAEDI